MPETLEIIFDSADRFPGKISFDVSIRDHRYIDHRDAATVERSKIAADITDEQIEEDIAAITEARAAKAA